MDWSGAERREGKPTGTVVSVRLHADEAERLRGLAASLELNMSQVLRQALSDFDPASDRFRHALIQYISPFTFGGGTWIGRRTVREEDSAEEADLAESPSKTIDTRVRERVGAELVRLSPR
jgi:hypothetical protein